MAAPSYATMAEAALLLAWSPDETHLKRPDGSEADELQDMIFLSERPLTSLQGRRVQIRSNRKFLTTSIGPRYRRYLGTGPESYRLNSGARAFRWAELRASNTLRPEPPRVAAIFGPAARACSHCARLLSQRVVGSNPTALTISSGKSVAAPPRADRPAHGRRCRGPAPRPRSTVALVEEEDAAVKRTETCLHATS
jgi:hypothetical protein